MEAIGLGIGESTSIVRIFSGFEVFFRVASLIRR
jgi:hypothetical protein